MRASEESQVLCPVCASLIAPEDSVAHCPRCETPAHQECWDYVGSCAIFGCVPPGAVVRGSIPAGESALSLLPIPGATEILLSLFTWVLRLHWWAFAGLNLGLASLIPAAFWMPLGAVVGPFLGMLVMGSLFSYLALSLPLLFLRGLLQLRLALSLATPKKEIRKVLDRVEFAPAESLAKRLSDLAPRVYRWISGLGLLWMCRGMLSRGALGELVMALVFGSIAILLGYLPLAFLESGTRDRLVFVTTVQNRIIASTKGRALLSE